MFSGRQVYAVDGGRAQSSFVLAPEKALLKVSAWIDSPAVVSKRSLRWLFSLPARRLLLRPIAAARLLPLLLGAAHPSS